MLSSRKTEAEAGEAGQNLEIAFRRETSKGNHPRGSIGGLARVHLLSYNLKAPLKKTSMLMQEPASLAYVTYIVRISNLKKKSLISEKNGQIIH